MELLLIRHALPVRRELETGRADPELAQDGHAQAKHLAAYLEPEQLAAVYSSPLRRARQTAEPVVSGRDLAVQIEPHVAEIDEDSPEYVPVEELKASGDPRWQQMLDGTMQHWGDPDAFRARVIAALERMITAHRGEKIAVVCHGAVINAYLMHVLAIDGDARGFFYPNYTSIHRIAAASSGERTMLTINETAHLRGTDLPVGLFGG